ncbi:piggyBac transposable element-derived protein 3-like [Schistocerca americana]|uniref:piggyBac transposable element-derived protein 3-like n=1 Tax=Schistocerca americana TaxID=7009 RepID=UPI001F4F2B65|nr:piggyBac transposable element-derived protein 3-like [Schistocerca americana]
MYNVVILIIISNFISLHGLSDNRIRSLLDDSDLSGISSDEDDEFVPSPSNIQQADDSFDDLSAEEVPEERRSSHSVTEGVTPLLFRRSNFVQKFHPPNINYSAVESLSPIGTPAEFFCEYFSEKFFEEAVKYTNMYSNAKTGKSLGTTAHELKVFFGINVMIGCVRNNVHFVDTIKPPNRLWKVQPVIDTVRRRCHSLPRSFNYYSLDEQMIPFTGRCKLKQYAKGKPRPVGLKNFIMTSASGSLVYFDRHFTTILLLAKLKEKGIKATGTIMVNRIKNFNLKEGRMKRGECHSYVRADEAVVITEWQDSPRVVIASTCAGIEPKCKVQRWCKQEGHYLDVDCPFVIQQYNANMGGVDIHDQQVECHRTWFRIRKWTLKCLLHFIDLSVVNCWFLYREHCRENQTAKKNIMDLLKFRMSLAEALLSCPDRKTRAEEFETPLDDTASTSTKAKVYKPHPKPGLDKRYDGYDHWPTVDDVLSP